MQKNWKIPQPWDQEYSEDNDYRALSSIEYTLYLNLRLKYGSRPELTALDIGCGTGLLTRELFHAGFKVCGVDFSTEAIERARQRTIKNITYVTNNVMKVADFPHKNYTLVCCRLVWAFIEDKPMFLEKVLGILKRDGSLVITLVDKDAIERRFHIASDIHGTEALLQKHFAEIKRVREGHIVHFICTTPKTFN